MTPDTLFVESVVIRICKKIKTEGVGSINRTEKILDSVWFALGLIGNGGIQYWLLSERAHPSIVDDLIEIDASDLSSIICKVFKRLPDITSKPTTIKEKAISAYENELNAMNHEWRELEDTIPPKLVSYIRENWDDLHETIINHYAFWS